MQQITMFLFLRDPIGRAVLPCVSARFDFLSRGCVSYALLCICFFFFFFLLNTYFMCNWSKITNWASRIYSIYIYTYIDIYTYIYIKFVSVSPPNCTGLWALQNIFNIKFQIKFQPSSPTESFFSPFLAGLTARFVS